jgi:anaerobic selenocysteine-containing dehydrogenase
VPLLRSACPLDCPDACSLEVKVEAGRVVSVGGSHDNPLTDGYICAKVRRYPEHLYGPERLLSPGIREGKKGEGRFRPASWEEALDLVARKMLEATERFGGESILPYSYGGSNGYLSQDNTDARLFRRLGASRLARTVCAAPSTAAASGLFARMSGIALDDYVHARLVLLWGVNPSASGIHLVPRVYEAQHRGAKLVVVDPRATPLARRADVHLAPRPGTDLPLALAVVRWLFENGRADQEFLARHTTGADRLRRAADPWTIERAAAECGVPAGQIEALASLYADSSPAALRCGWGLERSRNGGSAVAAVLALPAVAGKFGIRGGGYTMSNSGAWKFDAKMTAGEPEPATRLVNMNHLGETLVSGKPPVAVLFVYNSNALMTSPRQALVREGLSRQDLFTVVFDSIETDTAAWADVVLPATAFLEHRELSRGYGAFALQDAPALVAPPGDARPNAVVFAELCRRTGVARAGEPSTPDEIAESILAQSPRAEEIRRQLREGVAVPDCGDHPVQFQTVFPEHPDSKAHLFPEELDLESPAGLYGYRPDPATAAHPLALILPASDRTISSTFGQLWKGRAALEIHPDDAAARRIGNDAPVRVYNELGEVLCRASVTSEMRPGVVRLPKGLWARHTDDGATANAMVPDTLTDLGGGACFNDARVEVTLREMQ